MFADGRLILQKEVRFGEAIPIDVDVRDVLRLTLVVTNTGTDECAFGAAWADPTLIGHPDEVPPDEAAAAPA
ncbi:MAG: NPCBM/NEW2 domain-containing protein [Egibacteraceae bacterium]